jgi:hypothetical protein
MEGMNATSERVPQSGALSVAAQCEYCGPMILPRSRHILYLATPVTRNRPHILLRALHAGVVGGAFMTAELVRTHTYVLPQRAGQPPAQGGTGGRGGGGDDDDAQRHHGGEGRLGDDFFEDRGHAGGKRGGGEEVEALSHNEQQLGRAHHRRLDVERAVARVPGQQTHTRTRPHRSTKVREQSRPEIRLANARGVCEHTRPPERAAAVSPART